MPSYTFVCKAKDHLNEHTRQFVQVIYHRDGKRIDQTSCPTCGAVSKRDLVADLGTVNINGLTPLTPSDSRFAPSKETEFAFGKFKVDKTGKENFAHSPFRDTGELEKFMNGNNDLGEPELNQSTGQPLRRKDGSVVRQGAKLFKYGKNATPSRDGLRKPFADVPNAWVDEKRTAGARGGMRGF